MTWGPRSRGLREEHVQRELFMPAAGPLSSRHWIIPTEVPFRRLGEDTRRRGGGRQCEVAHGQGRT
jgi:hypothetical protein